MSDTACVALSIPRTVLGRVLAGLDQLLLNYAESTIRGGDTVRCIM